MQNKKIINAIGFICLVLFVVLVAIEKKNAITTNYSKQPTNNLNNEKFNRKKHFGSWKDLNQNGLNARYELLFAGAQQTLVKKNKYFTKPKKQRKHLENNVWIDGYTKLKIYFVNDATNINAITNLQVDHVVSVVEAWKSGACHWSANKRKEFYNWGESLATKYKSETSLGETIFSTVENSKIIATIKTHKLLHNGFFGNLVLTHASENQKKSSLGPENWLPSNPSTVVSFLNTWVITKLYWNLSVDAQEKLAIEKLLGSHIVNKLRQAETEEEGCYY